MLLIDCVKCVRCLWLRSLCAIIDGVIDACSHTLLKSTCQPSSQLRKRYEIPSLDKTIALMSRGVIERWGNGEVDIVATLRTLSKTTPMAPCVRNLLDDLMSSLFFICCVQLIFYHYNHLKHQFTVVSCLMALKIYHSTRIYAFKLLDHMSHVITWPFLNHFVICLHI